MTSVARSYFRLRPYVFLVKGAKRSALYDLHRRRIFPIPASAAYVLDRCAAGTVEEMLQSIDDADDRAIAAQYLEQLGDMDFGRCHDDVSTLIPFNDKVPERFFTRVSTLSIDLREENDDPAGRPDWAGIVTAARRDHGCRQLTVFVTGDERRESTEMPLLECAAALRYHHIEVVFPDAAVTAAWESLCARAALRVALQVRPDPSNATYRRLQEANLNVRFCGAVVPTPISTGTLICNHGSFRRFRNASVHCHSLHIDSTGDVFPWALERHHLIGKVSDAASFHLLMRSSELRRAWTFNKDQIDVCKQCEFRYACPHSYSFRTDAERVGSGPSNCGYDPLTGTWRDGGNQGLFDQTPAGQLVEMTSKYFVTVSHTRNELPESYVHLLDDIVEHAATFLGIAPPSSRIHYYFYPTPQELHSEISRRDGLHVGGLTEYSSDSGRTVIRTSYPGHAHEVLHAVLFTVNPEPRFFVSEACATIFGSCWGTDEDIIGAPAAFSLEGDIRVTTADGTDVDFERCLLYDDKGLFIGPLRRERSVHAVARHLLFVRNAKPYLHSWFHAIDESALPRYFYQLGGSFFLWLIETRGKELFVEFYRSRQTLRHLEGYYGADLATLTGQWIAFLASN